MSIQLIKPLPSSLFLIPCPNIAVENGHFYCPLPIMRYFYEGYSRPIDKQYLLQFKDLRVYDSIGYATKVSLAATYIRSLMCNTSIETEISSFHVKFKNPVLYNDFVPHSHLYLCTCEYNINWRSISSFFNTPFYPFSLRIILEEALAKSPDGTTFEYYECGRRPRLLTRGTRTFGRTILKQEKKRGFWE
jgi:hypothetical protein